MSSMRSLLGLGTAVFLCALAGCAHRPTAALRSAEAAHATSLRRIASLEELRAMQEAGEQFAEDAEAYRRQRFCADPSRSTHWKCTGEGDGLDRIVVTGSRIVRTEATSPHTIADGDAIGNNQVARVDEGDLVKKLGNRLIVLRQGHLLVVELVAQGRPDLRLVESVLIADDEDARGTWYDEMIAAGGRVVLLGFNPRHRVAELNVLDLGPDGRLQRRARHWLPSQDYYDDTNYGARFVGEELLLTFSFELDMALRRWPEARRRDVPDAAAYPLLAPEDVHVPLAVGEDPSLHAILRCPIASLDQPRLACRATAVVGSARKQFYATPRAAYLALAEQPWRTALDWRHEADELTAADRDDLQSTGYTLVYRLPLDGGALDVAQAEGVLDAAQFGFHEAREGLYLLTERRFGGDALLQLIAPGAFGPRPAGNAQRLARLPVEAHDRPWRLTRFAHGAVWLTNTRHDEDGEPIESLLLRQPLAGGLPQQARFPHGIDRLDPFGPWMLLSGVSREGVQQLHALQGTRVEPAGSWSTTLPDHYVSEDRSHAFNAAPAGAAWHLGLPVVSKPLVDADTWPWPPSDLAFFAVDAAGLRMLGVSDMPDDTSSCEDEVCEEWYGNARLFFIGSRTFALSGDWLREVVLSPRGVSTLREVQLK